MAGGPAGGAPRARKAAGMDALAHYCRGACSAGRGRRPLLCLHDGLRARGWGGRQGAHAGHAPRPPPSLPMQRAASHWPVSQCNQAAAHCVSCLVAFAQSHACDAGRHGALGAATGACSGDRAAGRRSSGADISRPTAGTTALRATPDGTVHWVRQQRLLERGEAVRPETRADSCCPQWHRLLPAPIPAELRACGARCRSRPRGGEARGYFTYASRAEKARWQNGNARREDAVAGPSASRRQGGREMEEFARGAADWSCGRESPPHG